MAQLKDTDITGDLTVTGDLDVGGLIGLDNGKYITAKDTYGTSHNILCMNTNNNLVLGYSLYSQDVGNTLIYGNDVKITSKSAGLSSRSYGVNKVLWSGGYYMSETQTITLSEAVSAQPHGIVLVWSHYNKTDKAPDNYNFNSTFIPKLAVATHGGCGHDCVISTAGSIYHKYVYISNTSITGYSKNDDTSNTFHDKTIDFTQFVLRYVLGV